MDVRKQDASRQGMEAEPGALRDSVLASACRAGSADAFAEVERLYSRKLYSTIFRITKNREDAEDALQEHFCEPISRFAVLRVVRASIPG